MRFTKNEVSFYILTLGLILGIGYYLYKFHFSVINSSAFSSFVTLLVGGVAIFLYVKQKTDTKVQAARVLLLEIRTAEERIRQIKEKIQDSRTEDLPTIFPTKSWKVYSHLFIGDFDQDELKMIGDFYDYGDLIEEFAKRNNDFFWVTTEERARVVQQTLAQFVVKGASVEERNKRIEEISNDTSSPYTPNKTISAVKNYLEKINLVSTTSAGVKLKKLARM